MADFSDFWTSIHLVSFDNDLWLLDPSKDRLVMLVPESFWYDSAVRFSLATSAQALGAIAAGSLLARGPLSAPGSSPALTRQPRARAVIQQ